MPADRAGGAAYVPIAALQIKLCPYGSVFGGLSGFGTMFRSRVSFISALSCSNKSPSQAIHAGGSRPPSPACSLRIGVQRPSATEKIFDIKCSDTHETRPE
jgi:hypothetical protein